MTSSHEAELDSLQGNVDSLKRGWVAVEDGVLAQRMGSDEWESRKNSNVAHRRNTGNTLRADIPVARTEQEQEYARLQEIAQREKKDAEVSRQLQEAEELRLEQARREKALQVQRDAEHAAREAKLAAKAINDMEQAAHLTLEADMALAKRIQFEEEAKLARDQAERMKLAQQAQADADYCKNLAAIEDKLPQVTQLSLGEDSLLSKLPKQFKDQQAEEFAKYEKSATTSHDDGSDSDGSFDC